MNKTATAVIAGVVIAAAALFVAANKTDACARSAPGCWALRVSPNGKRKERRSYRPGVIIRAPFEGTCEAVKECKGHEGDEERFGP